MVERLRSYVSTNLWVLPGAILVASVLAAITTTLIDRSLSDQVQWGEWLFFTGSPEAAREIFSTIAGSMLTITGVVFSITMLVLQLASSQFSPRALRTFLQDVPSKIALGTFVGTFAFALVGLSTVRSTDDFEFVPRLTVTVAFILVIASLAMFLHYINHTAQQIQVTSIIKSIGQETVGVIERRLPEESYKHPEEWDASVRLPYTLKSQHVGVVLWAAEDKIVRFAQEHDAFFELIPSIGSFVPQDSIIMRCSAQLSAAQKSDVLSYIAIGTDRNLHQDVAYGFRELTDIALRALSPAMNDITTATNVIDAEHDLLLRVGLRADPIEVHVDDQGVARLLTNQVRWEDYLRMVFGEIGAAGKDFERIGRHLDGVAADLAGRLSSERVQAIRLFANGDRAEEA